MADAAGHDEARAAYLTAAFGLNDLFLIVDTLNAVARVHGLDVISRETGIPVVRLEQALSSDAIPDLQVFVAVVGALGLRLAVLPA